MSEENPKLSSVTIKGLRNHTSGMPRLSNQFSPADWSDPFQDYTDSLLLEELATIQPDTSGTFSYSNLGFGLLGKVLERRTDKSFETLMGALLRDTEMGRTYLSHEKAPNKRMAQPTNIGTKNSYWHFGGPSRYAGGLITCTSDLLIYLKFQQASNPMFRSAEVEKPVQTGIDDLGEARLFYQDGWFVLKPDSTTEILLHNGGTGGFTSFVAYNKKTQTGVAVLSNSVSLVDDIGIKLIYEAYELNQPERTIAYQLADRIDEEETDSLVAAYEQMKDEGLPDNVLDTYWLERFYFGKGKFPVSNQLSDIMLKVLPDDWEVWDIKGQNLEQLERYAEAKAAYETALELNPENEALKTKIYECKTQGQPRLRKSRIIKE